jgi:Rrf2 family protein
MQLTKAADYAVRIMIHLATLPAGERVNRLVLAESGEIPEHFVGKILQTLCKAGLIASHRGSKGGFALAAAAERVSVLDIVEAIEGPTQLNACMGQGLGCSRKTWCPAHPVWVEAQQAMTGVLRRATIAELARRAAPSPGEVVWN